MTVKASLGELIREKREGLGLTQEYVADEVGVSQSSVSWWEADATKPGIENLMKLATVLKVSAATLLKAVA